MKKISVNCFPEPPPLPFSCLLVHSKWGKKDLILYICSFSAVLHFPNSKIFSNTIFFKLSMTVLYFPYLIFGLALLLVLLERLLTRSRVLKTWFVSFLPDKISFRFFWTGQRIEKFYQLLVKDAIKVWVLSLQVSKNLFLVVDQDDVTWDTLYSRESRLACEQNSKDNDLDDQPWRPIWINIRQ